MVWSAETRYCSKVGHLFTFVSLILLSFQGAEAGPCSGHGQVSNQDSDSLYAAGTQLLKEGAYRDAVECLNRGKSIVKINYDINLALVRAFIASDCHSCAQKELVAIQNIPSEYSEEYQAVLEQYKQRFQNEKLRENRHPLGLEYSDKRVTTDVVFKFLPSESSKNYGVKGALTNIATLKYEGKFDEALKAVNALLLQYPESPTVNYYAGIINYEFGALNSKNAIKYLVKADQLSKAEGKGADSDIVVALARAYKSNGQKKVAYEYLVSNKSAFRKQLPGTRQQCIKAASIAYGLLNELGATEKANGLNRGTVFSLRSGVSDICKVVERHLVSLDPPEKPMKTFRLKTVRPSSVQRSSESSSPAAY